MQILDDSRIKESKNIIENIIGIAERSDCKAMITRDNTLVIIVMSTALYITKLTTMEFGEPICYDYKS